MTDPDRRPIRVTLKLATSLDGAIATHSGHSQWITGKEARGHVHQMRADHDCITTGIGTVLADDPELTARLVPAAPHQPLRVVLDSEARILPTAKLLKTQNLGPVCLFHRDGLDQTTFTDSTPRFSVSRNQDDSGLDLLQVLIVLQHNYDVRSVMIEAGAQLAGAFLRAGLVDKVVWFRAPIVIGGDGLSVFGALGVDRLDEALVFDCVDLIRCGADIMETYELRTMAKGN